jgi:hypothetical protein
MATPNTTTLEQARAAKPKALAVLAALPLAGVGITRIGSGYGLKVNLRQSVAVGAVPEQVDGVPVTTEVVGEIQKRSDASRKQS